MRPTRVAAAAIAVIVLVLVARARARTHKSTFATASNQTWTPYPHMTMTDGVKERTPYYTVVSSNPREAAIAIADFVADTNPSVRIYGITIASDNKSAKLFTPNSAIPPMIDMNRADPGSTLLMLANS